MGKHFPRKQPPEMNKESLEALLQSARTEACKARVRGVYGNDIILPGGQAFYGVYGLESVPLASLLRPERHNHNDPRPYLQEITIRVLKQKLHVETLGTLLRFTPQQLHNAGIGHQFMRDIEHFVGVLESRIPSDKQQDPYAKQHLRVFMGMSRPQIETLGRMLPNGCYGMIPKFSRKSATLDEDGKVLSAEEYRDIGLKDHIFIKCSTAFAQARFKCHADAMFEALRSGDIKIKSIYKDDEKIPIHVELLPSYQKLSGERIFPVAVSASALFALEAAASQYPDILKKVAKDVVPRVAALKQSYSQHGVDWQSYVGSRKAPLDGAARHS